MVDSKHCPVCGLDAKDVTVRRRGSGAYDGKNDSYGQIDSVSCRRCGSFLIYTSDASWLEGEHILPDYRLSARIRELNDQNDQRMKQSPLGKKEIQRMIDLLPAYGPLEKQQKLLSNLSRKSEFPGHRVSLSLTHDWPLAWAVCETEFRYYIDALTERGLVENDSDMTDYGVIVSVTGWEYLEKYSTDIGEKSQAFVAMSFSDKMKPLWENSIKPAIQDAGYMPYRTDAEPHSDRIDVKIMAEIKNSRFVVADVTEGKRGVYFEAGFALGLGLPVIWCVKKEDLAEVHFDTRQYNHIVWESEPELKEQLYSFICAIIGKRAVTPASRV